MPRPSSSSEPAATGIASMPSVEKPVSSVPFVLRAMRAMSALIELPVRPTT